MCTPGNTVAAAPIQTFVSIVIGSAVMYARQGADQRSTVHRRERVAAVGITSLEEQRNILAHRYLRMRMQIQENKIVFGPAVAAELPTPAHLAALGRAGEASASGGDRGALAQRLQVIEAVVWDPDDRRR